MSGKRCYVCLIQENIGIGGVLSLLWFQRRSVTEMHKSKVNFLNLCATGPTQTARLCLQVLGDVSDGDC